MKSFSLIWTLLIAFAVFESAACSRSNPPEVRTRILSVTERRRQIELLNAIGPNEIEGKSVSDFQELFSLADEIRSKNGKIVNYVFHRKGEGGNDDGTDSIAIIFVEDCQIQHLAFIVYPS